MKKTIITLVLALMATVMQADLWSEKDPQPRDFMGCEMGVSTSTQAAATIGKEGVAHDVDSTSGTITMLKPMYAGMQYDYGMMSFDAQGRLALVQLYRHVGNLQDANDVARELVKDLERRYNTRLEASGNCYRAQAAGMTISLALMEDNQDSWMEGLSFQYQ